MPEDWLLLAQQPSAESAGISTGMAIAILAGIMVPILVPIASGMIYMVWCMSRLSTALEGHTTTCAADKAATQRRLDNHSDLFDDLKKADTDLAARLAEEIRATRHDVLNRADAAFVRKDIHSLEISNLVHELAAVKAHTGCEGG